MSIRDTSGFNNEINELTVLKDNGMGKYITFHNPTDFREWKKNIGNGVDFQIDKDDIHYDIEASYASHNYHYRLAWFYKSRLPRFRNCHEPDVNHKRVWLVNKLENFEGLSWLLNRLSILLLTVTMLIQLLNTTTSTTTPRTIHLCMPMVKVVDNRQLIDDPRHEAWLEELIDRAIKLSG
jgi:hypothetical protein